MGHEQTHLKISTIDLSICHIVIVLSKQGSKTAESVFLFGGGGGGGVFMNIETGWVMIENTWRSIDYCPST